MPFVAKPMIGKVFNRLTVLSFAGKKGNKNKEFYYLCQCSCGKMVTARGACIRRGSTKSCGCLKTDYIRKVNRVHLTNEDAAWAFNFHQYQRNARFRKVPCTLTFQEFKEICSRSCHYCGAPPEQRLAQRCRASIPCSGIDRVNNEEGYTVDNVVPCCTWCNQAKSKHSVEDFLSHCQSVAEANASIARHG